LTAQHVSSDIIAHHQELLWSDNITNEELWTITKQKPTEFQIKRRKWYWVGHTLGKEAGATEKTALDWNPQGYRRRGRQKENVGKDNRGRNKK
jgi:hypothetical protein